MNGKTRALRARILAALVCGLFLGLFPTATRAQTVIVRNLVPQVVYSPVVRVPLITQLPPPPAPVTVFSPVVPPPVVATPPVVVRRPAVTVYSPVVSPVPLVVTPRPVIVRPKVYVPGQPVRNVLRAITP